MREFENQTTVADRIVVTIDANHDVAKLNNISNDLSPDVRAFKLSYSLLETDRPWAIHSMLRSKHVDTWLDVNYMLDADQMEQSVQNAFNRGVKLISLSPLSGVESMVVAAESTPDNCQISVTMPNYHESLIPEFLENINTANDQLTRRKQIGNIACNVRDISTVKGMGDFTVIATGIRYDKQLKDGHPEVMEPMEAIEAGADMIAIGRVLTESKDSYKQIFERVAEDIRKITGEV